MKVFTTLTSIMAILYSILIIHVLCIIYDTNKYMSSIYIGAPFTRPPTSIHIDTLYTYGTFTSCRISNRQDTITIGIQNDTIVSKIQL